MSMQIVDTVYWIEFKGHSLRRHEDPEGGIRWDILCGNAWFSAQEDRIPELEDLFQNLTVRTTDPRLNDLSHE